MSSSVSSSMTAATSPPLSPYAQVFAGSGAGSGAKKEDADASVTGAMAMADFPHVRVPRLPHAVVSPDAYSHGEGFLPLSLSASGYSHPSMQELIKRYSPGYRDRANTKNGQSQSQSQSQSAVAYDVQQGRFLRRYRWGCVDPLNPKHCDFVQLREAVFHHMQVSGVFLFSFCSCATMSSLTLFADFATVIHTFFYSFADLQRSDTVSFLFLFLFFWEIAVTVVHSRLPLRKVPCRDSSSTTTPCYNFTPPQRLAPRWQPPTLRIRVVLCFAGTSPPLGAPPSRTAP
jgi:hypothetical protein